MIRNAGSRIALASIRNTVRFSLPVLNTQAYATSSVNSIMAKRHILCFSTSKPALLRIPRTMSIAESSLSLIPQAVKKFAYLTLGAGALILLTPGLILLVVPPILVGGIYVWRKMRQMKSEMQNQQWSDLSKFHLMPDTDVLGLTISPEARSRVADAIYNDEQGLGKLFSTGSNQISFGPAESFQQDIRVNSTGLRENLQIFSYPIYIGHRRVGMAEVAGRQVPGEAMRARISVKPEGSRTPIFLEWGDDDVGPKIIDLK